MSDVVEQGKSMLSTIEYARAKGIAQAYPDSSVAEVVGNLVAEVERLRAREEKVLDLCHQTGEYQARAKHINCGSARLLAVDILAALEAGR